MGGGKEKEGIAGSVKKGLCAFEVLSCSILNERGRTVSFGNNSHWYCCTSQGVQVPVIFFKQLIVLRREEGGRGVQILSL